MANGSIFRNERVLNLLFVVLAVATLLIRVLVFVQYSMVYIDGDQPIMWTAAHDYAQGIFSEPRFYAQDYNTHMESLFAVPLLWMEVPVYYALPLATNFIFIFPYLFTALYLFFKRLKVQAIALLSILLTMPASFDLMNSTSRGFVTGLFFASFMVINVLGPRRLGFLALNTSLAVIGFFVSPISLLATIPFSIYFFLYNYKNPVYFTTVGLCLALALPLHWLFNQFYLDHPEYVILGLRRNFSLDHIWTNLANLDLAFSHLSFFAEGKSFLLLAAWLGLLILLFRRNKNAFLAFITFLVLILCSFALDKSTEGTNWLYGARCRLYLPIPFVTGLFLAAVPIRPRKFIWLFIIPLFFAAYKMLNYERLLAWHFDEKNHWGINLMRLDKALREIDTYKRACAGIPCDYLLVSGRFWLSTQVAYGGPAIHTDYPATQLTNTERRYLVRTGNNDKVQEKFVFVSILYDFHEKAGHCSDFKLTMLDHYGMYLVTENRMKTGDFIEMVNNLEEKEIAPCQ